MMARARGRTGSGAAEISFSPFAATDDQGASYGMGLHGSGPGGPGGWILRLHPDPPRDLRWLDLTTTPGERAVRIDMAAAGRPGRGVTVRGAFIRLTRPGGRPLRSGYGRGSGRVRQAAAGAARWSWSTWTPA